MLKTILIIFCLSISLTSCAKQNRIYKPTVDTTSNRDTLQTEKANPSVEIQPYKFQDSVNRDIDTAYWDGDTYRPGTQRFVIIDRDEKLKEEDPWYKKWDWLLAIILSSLVTLGMFYLQVDKNKEIDKEKEDKANKKSELEKQEYDNHIRNLVWTWLTYIRDGLTSQSKNIYVYNSRIRAKEENVEFLLQTIPVDRFISLQDKDLMNVIGKKSQLYTKLVSNAYYIQSFTNQLQENTKKMVDKAYQQRSERIQLNHNMISLYANILLSFPIEGSGMGRKLFENQKLWPNVSLPQIAEWKYDKFLDWLMPTVAAIYTEYQEKYSEVPMLKAFMDAYHIYHMKAKEKSEYMDSFLKELEYVAHQYICMVAETTLYLNDKSFYDTKLQVYRDEYGNKNKNNERNAMDIIIAKFNVEYDRAVVEVNAANELIRRYNIDKNIEGDEKLST